MLSVITAAITITIGSVYAFDGCYNLGDVVQPKKNLSVSEAFQAYKIVPDYILTAPEDLLVAGYVDVDIRLGTKFSPIRTIGAVYLRYPNGKEKEMYTVMLLDIDISMDMGPAYIHGMFLNSPANNLLQGDEIVPYVPVSPTPGSGYHRYTGLVYRQPEYLNPNETSFYRLARERVRFSAMAFAKQYDLIGPMAGNFFLARNSMCKNCLWD